MGINKYMVINISVNLKVKTSVINNLHFKRMRLAIKFQHRLESRMLKVVCKQIILNKFWYKQNCARQYSLNRTDRLLLYNCIDAQNDVTSNIICPVGFLACRCSMQCTCVLYYRRFSYLHNLLTRQNMQTWQFDSLLAYAALFATPRVQVV